MREADVSAYFFQALQHPYLTSDFRSIYTAAKSAALSTLIGSSFSISDVIQIFHRFLFRFLQSAAEVVP